MFPFTPKHLSQARLYIREAAKLVAYRRDITPAELIAEIEGEIRTLEQLVSSKGASEPVEAQMRRLDEVCRKLHPPLRNGGWKENVEVFLVAISIALGVRTYFVQPFTIPTGSMQPTLNGIRNEATEEPPPNPVLRVVHWAVLGRSYFNLEATRSETIQAIRERHRFGIRLGPFTYTEIVTDAGSYSLSVPEVAVRNDRRAMPGRHLNPGDIIARGYTDSGDHVLVDKFSYHFVRPEAGNVFVFVTTNVPTREKLFNPGGPSQFYIKRIGGVAGDSLRIDPPKLFRNGEPATEAPFQRVMAGTLHNPVDGGYKGYSNGPQGAAFQYLGKPSDTQVVPENCYFALGDNSYHSSDSRDWGPVPQQNVVGRGLMVYWPFSRHWGSVR
jgi:signal peptidase I